MNILIIGCGRVGSHLVRTLEDLGHDVSVLEGDEKNVDRLLSMENHEFGGMVQIGSPIDEDMLRQAGIENCDAVAAVCPEDNINLMVCQIASEIFHVPRVLARVADPVRKKIFAERFGMHIICSTNLTVEAILRGVLTGSDAAGSFKPDTTIQRSEVATIVGRMADPSLRKTFTLTAGETETPAQEEPEAQERSPMRTQEDLEGTW